MPSTDEIRKRRSQATHPAETQAELVATGANQVCSWGITKLRGPDRGHYFDLYVILDIYSRYVVGWTLVPSESGELAKALITDCLTRQQISRDTLTIYADLRPPSFSRAAIHAGRRLPRAAYGNKHRLLAVVSGCDEHSAALVRAD